MGGFPHPHVPVNKPYVAYQDRADAQLSHLQHVY